MLSCAWDGAYKITFAANQKVAHVVAVVGFLSVCLVGPLINGQTPYNPK